MLEIATAAPILCCWFGCLPTVLNLAYRIMNSYKIFHISTLHPRADPRIFEKQLISISKRYEGEVALVCADGKGSVCEDKYGIVDLGVLPANRILRALVGNWRVWRYMSAQEHIVLHFHDPELIPVALVLNRKKGSVIYDAHEDLPLQIASKSWIPGFLHPLASNLASRVMRYVARKFAYIIAATPSVAERFSPVQATVICNYPIIKNKYPEKSVRSQDGIYKVGYVGALSEMRGLLQMCSAIEIINNSFDAELHLAGRYAPESLVDTVKNSSSSSNIVSHGYLSREEVGKLVMSFDCGLVVLWPQVNYLDSLPTKMFEYMNAGVPVVASNFPMWRSIVNDANCGLLVDPLDPKAIAQAVLYLRDNPDVAKRMGENGKKYVLEKYNWSQEENKLLQIYSTLVSS